MEDVASVNGSFDCGKWNLTEQEERIQKIHSWWIQGLSLLVFGSVGILVSVIAILVLSDKKLSGIFFNKLIMALTFFDIAYLILSIGDSIRFNFIELNYCAFPGYVAFLVIYPIRKILMCCSTYMTVVIAFERFSAIKNPITHRNSLKFSSLNMKTLKYVLIVGLISVLYGIPLFFAFQIKKMEDGEACVTTWLRSNENFVNIYLNIISLVITGIIPFLCLAFFYCVIFVGIKNGMKIKKELVGTKLTVASSTKCLIQNTEKEMDEKKSEMVHSMILIWIVILFLTCHIPRIALNIEEMLSYNDRHETMETAKKLGLRCSGVQFWELIATDWYYLLLCVNPLMNFFVYCYFSTKFQSVFKYKLLGFIHYDSPFAPENTEFISLGTLWKSAKCRVTRTYTTATKCEENTTMNEMTPLNPDLK